ncbi:uncharacterized protein BDCG_02565 [Blastomyces dermatitidis ER-3]|uniref:Uncharacterized protein n=2 Tax=Ajellomyces dermatitidis TaxID=5039 RepID=A0A0J9EJS9_AJEDA|nr:uncharacterized protein BDCG_02565 [Blastomyces dermatitidis ER-3]EEQ87445.1 hypothetical protein BDCG_02565 [Blastomyces dermatitidis ER-3]EQL38266.1 hypothetical protein BDFG_00633 [Blastomyces dermatitidis ATCC 26199]KMW66628.1 hypothetical protein BDDG_11623 [Blastomyces dermatitidis ATCC 18188]
MGGIRKEKFLAPSPIWEVDEVEGQAADISEGNAGVSNSVHCRTHVTCIGRIWARFADASALLVHSLHPPGSMECGYFDNIILNDLASYVPSKFQYHQQEHERQHQRHRTPAINGPELAESLKWNMFLI